MLFDASEEFFPTIGLGLLSGMVSALHSLGAAEAPLILPHIGGIVYYLGQLAPMSYKVSRLTNTLCIAIPLLG